MRLDKLLSNMGYGSRKDVKSMIKKKKVTMNGSVPRNSNLQVDPFKDEVKVEGEQVQYRKYIYLMMHKPPGYLSATEDARDKTVIDLVPESYQHFKPHPVGRLDKDTEGLLLITNDGELTHKLLSPKKDIEKLYFAKIKGRVTEADVKKFQEGIVLDDGYKTQPAKLTIIHSREQSEVEVTITEGKFHQVKRMFEAVDKQVVYLKRLRMGKLILDETLRPGYIRELTEAELNYCLYIKKNN
ncbi:pseudouridine synthase [Virgibacillus kekensis]|uniref:Pseudouridine synthase n=1 Tax=Virgibacillus kekensis TaxID=202261 RepID=A0ABV9DDC9_9BACI